MAPREQKKAPRKRHYVAKVKGCYECSQRRINCDGSTPSCKKCVSKGIQCSGLGIRYRFNNGIASRGKMAGMKTFSIKQEAKTSDSRLQDDWICVRNDAEVNKSHFSMVPTPSETIDPLARLLLSHFSDAIAPEMVMIDDSSNGWRSLVLPAAAMDSLVLDAVMAASAFHLTARESNQSIVNPYWFYIRAIRRLQERRDLNESDIQAQQFVLLSILILLVTVMINGSPDFPILFRMLQSAFDAIGGEDEAAPGSLSRFLLWQTRKMSVYGAPLLSREAGVRAISSQGNHMLPEHQHYRISHADCSTSLTLVTNMVQQAFRMYLHRASKEIPIGCSATSVETFRACLESIPRGSPGERSLIWPVFIAALESRDVRDRAFFEEFLMRQHRINGFSNIPKALGLLNRFWTDDNLGDWTANLPKLQIFMM